MAQAVYYTPTSRKFTGQRMDIHYRISGGIKQMEYFRILRKLTIIPIAMAMLYN
jgi:hypothetical protein